MLTDLFNLIPQQLKQQLLDTVVDTVAGQADAVGGHTLAAKIRQLRSDASFTRAYEAGLQRAVARFIQEYEVEDEDLVTAVTQSPALFANKQVQASLLAMVSNPGQEIAEEQKALALRFDTVLPERKNRDRVEKAMTYLLRCLAEETWHLPELQPIYTLQFARMTAEATREQVALQKSQLAAVSTLGEDIREGLLQLTDIISRQKQANSGDTDSPQQLPAVLHNLPQRDYGEFVGREAALSKVMSLLQPESRHFLIVIDGVGGIGKSTLALEVAHRCLQFSQKTAVAEEESSDLSRLRQTLVDRFNEEELRTLCFDMALDYDMLPGNGKGGKSRELVAYLDRRNRLDELIENIQRTRPDIVWREEPELARQLGEQAEKFDAIIWASAKQTVLTADGIDTRRQVINTLEDIYSTIAVTLQREDITRDYKNVDRDAVVSRALTRQRTLLIVDNLETIADENVMKFLRELPHPTKAIVTTRRRIDASYPVRLKGMVWQDALTLIQQECKKKSIGMLTSLDQSRLIELTGGVPLAIVWSIAKIARGIPIDSVLSRLTDAEGDISKFCFSESVALIRNKPAYELLVSLSVFDKDASREALTFATELLPSELYLGLEVLETLSLINRDDNRFNMLPLTRTFANAELSNDRQYKEQLYRNVARFFVRFLLENRKGRGDHIPVVLVEKQNLLGVTEWAFLNDQEIFLDLVGDMDYYFSITGDWVNRSKYLRLGIDIADKLERFPEKARLLRLLAAQSQFQGDMNLAIKHANESYEISSWLGNRLELALVHLRYAAAYRELKEFSKAYQHANNALDMAKELNDSGLANRVYTVLTSIEINQENFVKANEYLLLIQGYAQKLNWRTTWQSRQAGEVAFGLERYEDAERLFVEAFKQANRIGNPELDPDKGNIQNMAEAEHCLAVLCFRLGDTERGKAYANKALTRFAQLGMEKHITRTRELIQNNSS